MRKPSGKGRIRTLLDGIRHNPCLVLSQAVYGVFSRLDPRADWRINIIVSMSKDGDWGHAWVTRNGRDFIATSRSARVENFTEMGTDGKYHYYIREPNIKKYFNGR